MAWVYLDDQFPDHPKIVLAGGDAGWLFVCGLAYCRRQETRGRIPVMQVPRLSDRKQPGRLARRLVDVGLWEPDGEFYIVHDFDDWNRPEESRRAAGRKAAKARWDKKRNANADANASESHTESTSEPDADRCPSPLTPSLVTSQSSTNVGRANPDDRLEAVAKLLANADLEQLRADRPDLPVEHPERWLVTAERRRLNQDSGSIRAVIDGNPTWTPEQCAASLLAGVKPTVLDDTLRAQHGIMERNRRRLAGEACELCNDVGVVEHEDGTFDDCECKYAKAKS